MLITALVVRYFDELENLERALSYEFKINIVGLLEDVVELDNRSDVDDRLLDIALEGLSHIWFRYPALMPTKQKANIFKTLMSKLKPSTGEQRRKKRLSDHTASMIITTFSRMLSQFQIGGKSKDG